VRALIYVRLPEGKVDERGFAVMKQIGAELPPAERVGITQFKEIVKAQYLIVLQDSERAIAALPKLLPDNRQRDEALKMLHRLIAGRGALSEEGRHRLERVEALLAAPPAAPPAPSPAKVGRERAA